MIHNYIYTHVIYKYTNNTKYKNKYEYILYENMQEKRFVTNNRSIRIRTNKRNLKLLLSHLVTVYLSIIINYYKFNYTLLHRHIRLR